MSKTLLGLPSIGNKFLSVALVSAIALVGCNDDSDEGSSSASLSDFNLLDIAGANTANSDGSAEVRMMTLTWDTAATEPGETGITYTLCQADTSANGCLAIGEVTDELSATVEVDSLLEAVSANYFVMASKDDETVLSSVMEVPSQALTDMIGYFKAFNTNKDVYYGRTLAMSADGLTIAVAAGDESSAASGIDGDGVYSVDSEDPEYANYSDETGAVYVYSYFEGAWHEDAYIKASNSGSIDNFGHSISLSDDGLRLAVGASGEDSPATGVDGFVEDDGTADNSGAVYLFERTESGWSEVAYIKASNTDGNDFFGGTVSLSGDGALLAVGSTGESSATTGVSAVDADLAQTEDLYQGAVYIFEDGDAGWEQTAHIKASNAGDFDRFGISVDVDADGNVLVVSASEEDSAAQGVFSSQDSDALEEAQNLQVEGEDNQGAVYVFKRDDAGIWTEEAYIKASNSGDEDELGGPFNTLSNVHGVSVSDDGSRIAVGAIKEDSASSGVNGELDVVSADGEDNQGIVYLFDFDGSVWVQTASFKASNPGDDDYFGTAVSLSGDGNYLAVGAEREDSAATGFNGTETEDSDTETNYAFQSGAVYLFALSDSGWAQEAYIKAPNTNGGTQNYFGTAVVLNEDGSALLVGADEEASAATGINGDQTYSVDQEVNFVDDAGAAYLY